MGVVEFRSWQGQAFTFDPLMHDLIVVIILGIIEGFTEFLPISSTAHLLIAEHWLSRQSDLFNIVIQSTAVIAVLPLFHKRFHQFVFHWREEATKDYAKKIFFALAITFVGGFLLDWSGFTLPEKLWPVACALLVGGIGFLLIEYWIHREKPRESVTWTIAAAAGIGQLIAAGFPGTLRSGATILLMLMFGLNRVAATEFSFLIAIPTMLGAGGLKILHALHNSPPGTSSENWTMVLLGCIFSTAVSFFAAGWLLSYIKRHTFVFFGWYRIALAIGLLLLTRG